MTFSRKITDLLTVLIVASVCGCDKPASEKVAVQPAIPQAAPPPAASLSRELIGRIHWLGIKRLAAETNAGGFLKIWDLPESTRLEAQTLDKLATAPWRLLKGEAGTNAASALLRPLLTDLVESEVYVETVGSTNHLLETVLAIRLDATRAALWETNLAGVLNSLTGIKPIRGMNQQTGWSLKKHDFPNLIEFKREGDWVMVGLGQDRNALLEDFKTRLARQRVPFEAEVATYWIESQFDLARLVPYFSFLSRSPEIAVPRISVAVSGDGKNVLTKMDLQLSEPLSELKPWIIPTNLIDGTFVGLTACRGMEPWLRSQFWNDRRLGAPPNQVFIWSLPGVLMQTYFAAPSLQASNDVDRLGDSILRWSETRFSTNEFARFERSQTYNGLEWKGAPFVMPFLRSTETTNEEFIFGGFFTPNPPLRPFPQELADLLRKNPNLVAYDWELTGPRIDQWTYLGQFMRVALRKAQIPNGSAGLAWLQAMASRLGNSGTEAIKTDSNHLSLSRRSSIGLTALELHLLVDWLESPDFPRGCHTLRAPPAKQP